MKEIDKISLSQAEFWVSLCSAIQEAGGAINFNDFSKMTLVEFSNLFAQNNIRIIYKRPKNTE